MKCIILFTFITLCYSYSIGNTGGKSVNINDDGSIVITGTDGKRVTIAKGVGANGQKNIDIAISGPNIPTKRIQINEQNDVREFQDNSNGRLVNADDEYQRDKRSSKDSRQRFQGDILSEILGDYQGVVGDRLYQQLLQRLNSAVRSGQLNESVLEVLQSLNQDELGGQKQGWWGQQNVLRQQNQGTIGGQVTVLDLLQRQQQLERLVPQQQRGYYGVQVPTYGQQKIFLGQKNLNPFNTERGIGVGATVQGVVLEVPAGNQQGEIIEEVLVDQPLVISTIGNGQVYGGWNTLGSGIRTWTGPKGGQRTIWEGLLNAYNTQQLGGIGQYGEQGVLSQMMVNEK